MSKGSLRDTWLAGAVGVCLSAGASSAVAATVTIVADNATPGHYNSNVGDLGAPSGTLPWFPAPNTFSGTQDQIFSTGPDLSAVASLGNWLSDPANLNSNWSSPMAIPQTWAVNQEVAVVYSFDAGAGLRNLTASFGSIDNGINIWVDGAWKFGARDPEGRPWTGIALGDVSSGTHYIQILLEDSGGATAYGGPSISGTEVPIPPAAWLFISGVLGLVGISRPRKRR